MCPTRTSVNPAFQLSDNALSLDDANHFYGVEIAEPSDPDQRAANLIADLSDREFRELIAVRQERGNLELLWSARVPARFRVGCVVHVEEIDPRHGIVRVPLTVTRSVAAFSPKGGRR